MWQKSKQNENVIKVDIKDVWQVQPKPSYFHCNIVSLMSFWFQFFCKMKILIWNTQNRQNRHLDNLSTNLSNWQRALYFAMNSEFKLIDQNIYFISSHSFAHSDMSKFYSKNHKFFVQMNENPSNSKLCYWF